MDLVLASASPRRRALLEEAEISHRIRAVDVDEIVPPGADPADHVLTLAERKARAAAESEAGSLVLGADTVVVLDSEILGKPGNPEAARATLSRLSGRKHVVWTGVCLLDTRTGLVRRRAVSTTVGFRPLDPAEIDDYVASGEPFDKAGGYGIQGSAAAFVAFLDGSLDNVVGLPVTTVRELLNGG